MQLRVENLGRIRSTSIDLRGLTLLVGPNHTNKTWLAAAIVAALRDVSGLGTHRRDDPRWDSILDATAWSTVERLLRDRGTTTIDLDPEALVSHEPQLCWSVHPTDLSRMIGADVGPARCTLEVEREELSIPPTAELRVDADEGRFTVRWAGRETSAYHVGSDLPSRIRTELAKSALQGLARKVVPFPIERIGADRSGAGAVELFWSEIDQARGRSDRPSVEGGPRPELLARVLQGRVTSGAAGELRFQFEGGPVLPVQASASMIRSMAALQLYLLRSAQPGDVVVIDEPEMNAHPQAQLAITELLTCMVRWGIRVVAITHSPYVVDHVNNLMAAHEAPTGLHPILAQKFALGTPDAYISPDEVAAYTLDVGSDGTVHAEDSLDRTEALIDDQTFGLQTDRLQDIFGTILQRTSTG